MEYTHITFYTNYSIHHLSPTHRDYISSTFNNYVIVKQYWCCLNLTVLTIRAIMIQTSILPLGKYICFFFKKLKCLYNIKNS